VGFTENFGLFEVPRRNKKPRTNPGFFNHTMSLKDIYKKQQNEAESYVRTLLSEIEKSL